MADQAFGRTEQVGDGNAEGPGDRGWLQVVEPPDYFPAGSVAGTETMRTGALIAAVASPEEWMGEGAATTARMRSRDGTPLAALRATPGRMNDAM
jgi:hypothetical protein